MVCGFRQRNVRVHITLSKKDEKEEEEKKKQKKDIHMHSVAFYTHAETRALSLERSLRLQKGCLEGHIPPGQNEVIFLTASSPPKFETTTAGEDKNNKHASP